tara:strand:- start:9469 stop:10056 length:588 start_codon:yes stop_codon:yes gene_type:complete
MIIENIKAEIEASINVKKSLISNEELLEKISDLSEKCISSIRAGGKVIFCGNGGSFADAQHLSAEFTSRFLFDRPGLSSLALGTNSSAMTAIGNDYGYENVFSREIESIACSIDVIIAITTSGNSSNILKAIEIAKAKNIFIAVLTGASNGKLPKDVFALNVPSADTARIQESHILIGHIICGLVEETIYGRQKP